MDSIRGLMATRRESANGVIGRGRPIDGLNGAGRNDFSLSAIVAGIWERCLYRVATLGFDLIILMFMALLLVGTVLAMGGHIRLFQATAFLPVAIAAAVLAIKAWRTPDAWRHEAMCVLRDWVPFVLIVFIYENLHDVAGQAMSFDIAGILNRWDVVLFGVEPTLWAQRFFSPVATDLMSISYALYFFEPLFIMFLLTLWDRRAEFRHLALCLTIVFILGFIGYILLPCSPPRYFIEHMYTDPHRLYGLFLFDWLQGTWDGLSVISGGAFPSLHVGISMVALIYTYRFRAINRTCRMLFHIYLPLVVSLWFSTVYLRHHWVIDIVAGWFIAGVGYACASIMMRIRRGLRKRYQLPFN